jgi:hypothetical protein
MVRPAAANEPRTDCNFVTVCVTSFREPAFYVA